MGLPVRTIGTVPGLNSYVVPAKISVPNTTIVGRAQIPDLANDLSVNMGINRLVIQSLMQIPTEFGPNGELVYGAPNDFNNQVRFVGGWSYQSGDTSGPKLSPGATTDYAEVTFYGTGLNILFLNFSSARGVSVVTDGGSPVTVTLSTGTSSAVLVNRNYSLNCVANLVSGLTLGLHTVKFTFTGGAGEMYGVEILNESSLVKVTPGSAVVAGSAVASLASLFSASYNAVVTGTRGGRVLTYLSQGGAVAQAFQAVNAASATLASADHTNEEIARIYNWREFSAGRTDDFGQVNNLAITNNVFTLDDGTTTLVGFNLAQESGGGGGCRIIGASGYFFLTFVGTGLDIVTAAQQVNVTIDGVSAGSTVTTNAKRTTKIVSGLPYGTHTIKMLNTSGGLDSDFYQFIVYQPKKPTLPAGAIELADYNVMANYVATTTGDPVAPARSSGILFKSALREVVYVGSWTAAIAPTHEPGYTVNTSTNGDYFEYTFLGTGIEVAMNVSANYSLAVQMDGVAYTGAATVSPSANGTWTAGTSTWTSNAGNGTILQISGLTYGSHKIRVTRSSGSGANSLEAVNVISLIHSNKSNLYSDSQNSLPVGSQGISDNRLFTPIPSASAQKAWAQAVGVSSSPTTSSTAAVPVPDMSVVVKTSGNPIEVYYAMPMGNSSVNVPMFSQLFIDGVQVFSSESDSIGAAGNISIATLSMIIPVVAGFHKVDVYWSTVTGTATSSGTRRLLKAREL